MRVRIGDAEIEVTGPRAFVEKKITDFIKQTSTAVQPPYQTPAQPTAPAAKTAKTLSPAQFFNKCNPRSDVDRALLAGYFLEKMRNQENFTAAEVRDLIKSAKRQPPTNPSDTINKNIKKGLIMAGGDRENKMAFVLTSDGETAVEEMLSQQ